MNCPECNAERKYVGISCPWRLLCKCEKPVLCQQCLKPAIGIEFPMPIKDEKEPKFASKGTTLFCEEHKPAGSVVSKPIPKQEVKEVVETFTWEGRKYPDFLLDCPGCKQQHKRSERKSRQSGPCVAHHIFKHNIMNMWSVCPNDICGKMLYDFQEFAYRVITGKVETHA